MPHLLPHPIAPPYGPTLWPHPISPPYGPTLLPHTNPNANANPNQDARGALEDHCAHQLQHGLDALGANLEHLIEQGVEVEAMARTNAYNQLAAQAASQYDTLEALSLDTRSAATSSIEEVRIGAELHLALTLTAYPIPNPSNLTPSLFLTP